MDIGSVAQWIEQLRPKEKVVRSTRARATNSRIESPIWAIFRPRSIRNRASYEEITHLDDSILELRFRP